MSLRSLLKIASCSALAAAGVILAPTPGNATTLNEQNLADLSRHVAQSFVGTIDSIEIIETDMGHGERITATVTAPGHRTEAGETVTWTQYRPMAEYALPGMPQYEVGSEYLLMLNEPVEGSPYSAPVGLGMGAWHVVVDENSGQRMAYPMHPNPKVFQDVDVAELSERMIERDVAARRVAPEQAEAARAAAQRSLTSLHFGGAADPMALLSASAVLAADPSPSETFRDESPNRLSAMEAMELRYGADDTTTEREDATGRPGLEAFDE